MSSFYLVVEVAIMSLFCYKCNMVLWRMYCMCTNNNQCLL